MARRPDLAQKLLDDLRQKKQQMGVSQAHSRQRSNSSRSDSYGSSKQFTQGTGHGSTRRETNTSIKGTGTSRKPPCSGHHRAPTTEVKSREIVPAGRAKITEQVADLSMSIAVALSKNGTYRGLEFLGNGVASAGFILQSSYTNFREKSTRNASNGQWVLTGQLPVLSEHQIGEISRGARQLDMILKAYNNGLIFDKNSVELSKMLLKGAKDLEASINMFLSMQEASDYRLRSQRNQIRLLDDNEEDENTTNQESERRMTLSTPKSAFERFASFFFKNIRVNKKNDKLGKKQIEPPNKSQSKLVKPGDGSNSSNVPSQVISHKHSPSCNLGSRPDYTLSRVRAKSSYSGELWSSNSKVATTSEVETKSASFRSVPETKTLSLPSSSQHDKVRIPNVIAKLMGLNEITSVGKGMKESDIQTDNMSKQGKRRESENSVSHEKASSPKFQQKFRQNGGMKPQDYDKVFIDKGKGNLETVNIQKIKPRASKVSQKPKFERHQEVNSNVRSKEYKLKDNTDGRQMMKFQERRKVEGMLEKLPKNNAGTVLRRSNGQADGKFRKQPPREQMNVAMSPKLPGHDPGSAKGNESRKENQGSRPGLKSEKEVLTSKNTQENKLIAAEAEKNNLLVVNSEKTASMISPKGSQPSMSLTITDTCLVESLHSKGGNDCQENGQKINKTTELACPAHIDELNGNIIQQPIPIEENVFEEEQKSSEPENAVTAKPANAAFMRNVDVMPTIEQKNRYSIRKEDAAKIKRSPLLKPYMPIGHDQGQRSHELLETTDEQLAISHPWENDKHLQEGAEQSNTSAVANDSVRPASYDLIAQEEIEVISPEQVVENITINDSGDQDIRMESSQNNLESSSHKPKERQCEGSDNDERDKAGLELIREEQLTEDEKHLMQILLSNQQFLNTTQVLFGFHIPANAIEATMVRKDDHSKLMLDCGYEIMRRKGKIEEFMLHSTKKSPGRTKAVSINSLIKDLNNDIKHLSFTKEIKNDEHDTAEHVHNLVRSDIEGQMPDINSIWDLGWNNKMLANQEVEYVVKGMERHILNMLITEVVTEML